MYGQAHSFSGVATDTAGNVYLTDTGKGNSSVQKFTADGIFITGWGSDGPGNGQFDIPFGIATDPARNVYVADSGNNRIQKFTADGAFITKWGSKGSGNEQFNVPSGVATDAAGMLRCRQVQQPIQKFTAEGAFITKWGYGPPSHSHRKRKPLVIPATRRKAFFRPSCGLAKRCRAQVSIKSGGKTLALGRYLVPAHSSRRVAITLTGAGRKALARERRIRAELTIIDTRTGKREALPVVLRR